MKKISLGLFLTTLLFLGCKSNSDVDANGIPNKVVIAMFGNSGENASSLKKAMAPLRNYFAQQLHKNVEIYYTTDYTAVVAAIHAKKADIAYLAPFSYILCAQKKDITPLVVVGKGGKATMYHSFIFVNKKSGIKTMDELKAKAKNLTLAFSDPASASGHLIPMAYLNTIGLSPDTAFKQTMFAGSHPGVILTVASGKVDVGTSAIEYGLNPLMAKGLVEKDQFNILWTSDPIVGSPIVIRNDLNKNFITKVKSLYLNLYKDAPEIFNNYIKVYKIDPTSLSYIAVDDSLYNGIRKIANGIKDLNIEK
jgi:phosphonate transport system substrate-binding protein